MKINNGPDWECAQSAAYKVVNLLSTINGPKLPIDPFEIIANFSDIALQTYSEMAEQFETSVSKIAQYVGSDDGVSFQKGHGKDSQFVILYNDTVDYRNRRRFTLAHELGHCLLNHKFGHLDNDLYDLQEKEANYFAKRLLAPLPLVGEVLARSSKDTAVQSISDVFEVSHEVAAYSIDNYKNTPFIFDDIGLCDTFEDAISEQLFVMSVVEQIKRNA